MALATLVLGFIGFSKLSTSLGENRSFLDIFYLTLQLITLESGAVSGPVPWQLELARFFAPLIAAYAALRALMLIFRQQFQKLRLKFYKNHVIVCGLGRKGVVISQRFRSQSNRVVVIEINENNDMIDQSRDQGMVVLIGDATEHGMLRKARVHKAKYLLSVCSDDGVNAEVAVRAREFVSSQKNKVLTCGAHIVDAKLCHLLREREIELGQTDAFRLEFLNIFDTGARFWLKEHPPFSESSGDSNVKPHILLVGLGSFGEILLVQVAKKWSVLSNSDEKLHMTVVDKNADVVIKSLQTRYPRLEDVCDVVALQMDVRSSEFEQGDFLFGRNQRGDVTSIFICLDNDSLGLSAALSLRQRTRKKSISIIVRMSHEAGLADLLKSEELTGDGRAVIHAFGLIDRTCQPELIIGGTHEILARAIHKDYVVKQDAAGETPETNPAMVPWDALPENLKESNRFQADHIGAKLRAVGCSIELSLDWDMEFFEFTDDEIELMAKMEHERWVDERRRNGWKKGQKNLKKKKTPYLVPWDELDEDMKERDREPVRKLPAFLAAIGFRISRIEAS
jgi:hypothetical protein